LNHIFVNKIHKALCSKYVESHGKSISQLSDWYISFTDLGSISDRLLASDTKDETIVPNAIDELISLGYVTEQKFGFSLTELGLKTGTMSFSQKSINFINCNPGIISSLALLVAIISLYFSYIKL
jgi:hypothetical protein